MYRLLPSVVYSLSGRTINSENSEATDWVETTIKVNKSYKNCYELFINGFGYSLFRSKLYAFMLIGSYNIKTGLGNLYKQHLPGLDDYQFRDQKSPNKNFPNMLKLGNYIDYNLCFSNEDSLETADGVDQSKYLQLNIASNNAFGVMKISPFNNKDIPSGNVSSADIACGERSRRDIPTCGASPTFGCVETFAVDDKISESDLYKSLGINTDEQELFEFYRKHSKFTAKTGTQDRTYAELLYPVENKAFYYRAGYKIGGWNSVKKEENILKDF